MRLERPLTNRTFETAMRVVPFHRMTIDELALARTLGVSSLYDRINEKAPAPDAIAHAKASVESDVAELVSAGLVAYGDAPGSFHVVGGSGAMVLLQAEDGTRSGQAKHPFFGADLTLLCGLAFCQSIFDSVTAHLKNGVRLFTAFVPPSNEPRENLWVVIEALNAGQVADLGKTDLLPHSSPWEALSAMGATGSGSILLLGARIAGPHGVLEYGEIWAASSQTSDASDVDVASRLMDRLGDFEDHFETSGLHSAGVVAAVRSGENAGRLASALFPEGVREPVVQAYSGGDDARALAIAERALEAVSYFHVPRPWDLDEYLGLLRNMVGFLKLKTGEPSEALSFFEDVVRWSRHAEHPLQWMHQWNLAQAAFAAGNDERAIEALGEAIHTATEVAEDVVYLTCSRPGSFAMRFDITGNLSVAELRDVIESQKSLMTGTSNADDLKRSASPGVRALAEAVTL